MRNAGPKLLGLTLIFALGACSNLRNDRTPTRTESAMTGGAGGALVGTGGGARVGGTAGTIDEKKAAENTETGDALGARLKTAQRQLADRQIFNRGLKYEIARHEQRLASLLAPDRAPSRAVEAFELRSTVSARVGELDRQARSWQETIDAHQAALRQAPRDPRAATLRKEVHGLELEQSELERHRKELVGITRRAK